jgi:hypothetical protein
MKQVNIPIPYTINNEPSVTELIPCIAAQSTIDYTFTKTTNLADLR